MIGSSQAQDGDRIGDRNYTYLPDESRLTDWSLPAAGGCDVTAVVEPVGQEVAETDDVRLGSRLEAGGQQVAVTDQSPCLRLLT